MRLENELEVAQEVDVILGFYMMKFSDMKTSWNKKTGS